MQKGGRLNVVTRTEQKVKVLSALKELAKTVGGGEYFELDSNKAETVLVRNASGLE